MQPQTIGNAISMETLKKLEQIPEMYEWLFVDLGEHGVTVDGIRTRYGVPCTALGVTDVELDLLPKSRFVEYYKENYEKAIEIYKLPTRFHYFMLDTAVEVGPALAVSWLSLAAGQRQAVYISQELLDRLKKVDFFKIVDEIVAMRRARLRSRRYDEPNLQKAANRITRVVERLRKHAAK